MDPKDLVLYHGWILYKEAEEEKYISFFLGNLRTRLRRTDIVVD
jgi:hypothetical protein